MEKENLKKWLKYIPEVLLIAGGLFCLLNELINASLNSLTTIAGLIIFEIIVITLLIWKNKYFAFCISFLLGCVSFYFILALLSEFGEFPAGSSDGIRMLLIGGLLFGGLLIVSIIMPIKYFKKRTTDYGENL